MPTYEYECSSCKKKHEIVQKITAAPEVNCPSCGKPTLKRTVPSTVAIQFKGSGFYINDYNQDNKDKPSGGCDKGQCGCH